MSDLQTGQDGEMTVAVANARASMERSAGLPPQPTTPLASDELSETEGRTADFPSDLREFYRASGVGYLGWMEIVHPADRDGLDALFRYDLEDYRDYGVQEFEGEAPSLDSLVFAQDPPYIWLYDRDPQNSGRIAMYVLGEPGSRKAFTAAPSLIGFVRCLADVSAVVALRGDSDPSGRTFP